MDDDADGEAEEAVDLAHPFGVAFGEVVVDGDDVDAAAGEGVEIAGKRGDEGFAFAGLHLGDFAGVQDDAADHLDVEVAHLHGALAGFADDGEGLGQDVVEGGFFGRKGRFSASSSSGSILAAATASAMRWRNSAVLARSSSSESAWMEASRSLICLTVGRRRFTARSLLVPKTFAKALSSKLVSFGVHFSPKD